jgi:hypothetical protein
MGTLPLDDRPALPPLPAGQGAYATRVAGEDWQVVTGPTLDVTACQLVAAAIIAQCRRLRIRYPVEAAAFDDWGILTLYQRHAPRR